MRLCSCATVYPDRERSIVGRRGCPECGGRGTAATSVTRDQWADLVAAGWSVDGNGVLRHAKYGRARVETALALAEGDERAAKRAAEKVTT